MPRLDPTDPIAQLSEQIKPLLIGNDYGTITAVLAALLNASLVRMVRDTGLEPPEITTLQALLRFVCDGILEARATASRES